MKTGLSVYLSYELKDIISLLHKAKANGFKYLFTSLHIPEEDTAAYKNKIIEIIKTSNGLGLYPIVDVSPRALNMLGIKEFIELKKYGIDHLRLDFGFSFDQIAELNKEFTLVFNASTFNDEVIYELENRHIDFSKVIGCHNFYPKKYTGLSKEKVERINKRLHLLGMKTMAFVMGDEALRGPLYEGLPTIEELRNKDVFYNALLLNKKLDTDIVVVGDFGLSDKQLSYFHNYHNGYIEVECSLNNDYLSFLDYVHHDRADNSEYFIRSHESIYRYKTERQIKPFNTIERNTGDICISNEKYLRYNGELEIMRKSLPADERVNVVGKADTKYLEFIDEHTGIRLGKKSEYEI